MTMNQIIQEKRKALGLTQEQVAECLGVSTPAVNKWEKGVTCPDLAILPALARLLKTDLNTLFCFRENLTTQEMSRYQNEISKVIEREGLDAGFQMARKFRREYPNCDQFLHYNTMLLEGLMIMSGLTPEEKKPYEAELLTWYESAAKSENESVRNGAIFTTASKYLTRGNTEKAQEMVDLLPDHYGLNKKVLQANIYLHQSRPEDAALLMAKQTMQTLSELQMVLLKLLDAEIAAQEYETAGQIAEISSKADDVFGLWEYNRYVAPLMVAFSRKDAAESIRLFRKMLDASASPWDTEHSPLFHRLPMRSPKDNELYKKISAPLLSDLEHNPDYDFMRKTEEFQSFLEEIRKKQQAGQ